ncbi:MAG: heat shock protein Hsp20 [Chlamydiales bacterium]|jgi:HSP20 family protein|nr:heat shock protein Hsp20 [Chlamydiales bacterium]
MSLKNWIPTPFNENIFAEEDLFRNAPWNRPQQSLLRNLFPELLMERDSADLALDMYEEKGHLVVEMNLPGIDPENIQVSVEGNTLNVSGDVKEDTEKKDRNYYRRQIKRGSFERRLALPYEVQAEQAAAEYRDGILKIQIPKTKATSSKRVEVKKVSQQ